MQDKFDVFRVSSKIEVLFSGGRFWNFYPHSFV